MFEDAEEPFWRFPTALNCNSTTLRCNRRPTWCAIQQFIFLANAYGNRNGNVVMVNTEADSFLTQQLFWDQNARKIYPDSFIHIVRTDRIIEGFESNRPKYAIP